LLVLDLKEALYLSMLEIQKEQFRQ